jgi:hypothetical protein
MSPAEAMTEGNNMTGSICRGNIYILVHVVREEKDWLGALVDGDGAKMTRCEACGRELALRRSSEDANDDKKAVHFCSVRCENAWKETMRNVSVAH